MGAVNVATLSVSQELVRKFALLWLGRSSSPDAGLADAIAENLPGPLERRQVTRQFDEATEAIAERLTRELVFFRELPEHEQAASVLAVTESLETLTSEDLLDANMNPATVADLIRRRSKPVLKRALLSEPAEQLYYRLLTVASELLISIIGSFPRFPNHALATLLQQQGSLAASVNAALEQLPAREVDEDHAYRTSVATLLDRVEVFGFDVSASIRRHRLTDTFTRPDVAIRRTPVPLDWALLDNQLLFLYGPAGSGKTSILKWLAVTCARQMNSGLLASMNDSLPVYVRARELPTRLKTADARSLSRLAFPAAEAAATESAIERRAREGSLLVLIDGLDETPLELRSKSRSWLRDLVTTYPDCRYVVTSRSAEWLQFLEPLSFTAGEVLPLNRDAVAQLVRQWFNTLRAPEPATRTRQLVDIIDGDSRLRDLTGTPLMCTLTCLLFSERGKLAFRGIEIYRAFIEMFLERRDVQRDVGGPRDVPRHEMLLLLGALALQMVTEGLSEVSSAAALACIDRELRLLPRVPLDSEETYEYLVRHSGLLIQPVPSRVQFVHRTFMEYLCAEAFLEHRGVEQLIAYAHEPTWRDIIPMTAAMARGNKADEIVRRLLDRYREEPFRRPLFDAVIQACVASVSRLDPALRDEVEHTRQELRSFGTESLEFTVRSNNHESLVRLHHWLCREMAEPTVRPVFISDPREDHFFVSSEGALSIGEITQAIVRWTRAYGPSRESRFSIEGSDGTTLTINTR